MAAEATHAVHTVDASGEHAEVPRPAAQDAHSAGDDALAELLGKVDAPATFSRASAHHTAPAPESTGAIPALRMARVVAVDGRRVQLAMRGAAGVQDGAVAAEVDCAIVERAFRDQSGVLVECVPGEPPVIVGVVQTRVPAELDIRAGVIRIDAEHELVLRSGSGALRIREDGDIEVVGNRIAAASRGLFRLVGRVLRLN